MALEDIGREEIKKAIDQFEQIGLYGMLKKYEGGRSYRYFIDYKHIRYDMKLIVRAAHGFLPGKRFLKHNEIHSAPIKKHLETLKLRIFEKP